MDIHDEIWLSGLLVTNIGMLSPPNEVFMSRALVPLCPFEKIIQDRLRLFKPVLSSSPLEPHWCSVVAVTFRLKPALNWSSSLQSSLPYSPSDKPLQGTSPVNTCTALPHPHCACVCILDHSSTSHKRPTEQPTSDYHNGTNRHGSTSGGLQPTQLLGYVS